MDFSNRSSRYRPGIEDLFTRRAAHRGTTHTKLLADKPSTRLATVKRLLNAPHREHILAASARENRAMGELIGTGTNAKALASFLHR
ncbi:hypothetical protein VST63_14795 [Mycolicibacterium sp. 050232]|nr:hypothetical protein [Mycolicibacterium sp. 050232]MED5813625.1 hypothetical protein [Mycolicibacterium sp. 050232]